MKKITLFILALIAIVIADDDKTIEIIAEKFDTDVTTVQTCLGEVGISTADIHAFVEKWGEIKEEDVNEEVKQSLTQYNLFLACILEKIGMMVDTKLVVDKIIESVEKDKAVTNKEDFTKCINSLNEDSQMTREDRIFGLILCVINN